MCIVPYLYAQWLFTIHNIWVKKLEDKLHQADNDIIIYNRKYRLYTIFTIPIAKNIMCILNI